MNIKTKKIISIQVKWSKAFEPKKKEIEKYENGSTWLFFLKKDTIEKATADFFIFLVYVINDNEKIWRREIEPHTITIPIEKLKELCKHKKLSADKYSFYFRINPRKNIAFDFRDIKWEDEYYLTEYLDNNGIDKVNEYLQ